MAILDTGMERNNPLIEWCSTHGAAAALLGCVAFWIVLAASVYFIF